MPLRKLPRNFHSHEYGRVTAPPWWLQAPAYSVLPFIRRPLGLTIVHPRMVIARTFWLIVLPIAAQFLYVAFTAKQPPDRMGHIPLIVFALASLAISLVLFVRRLYGQRHGEELHSAEAGYSFLALYSTLPAPLCELLIVPLTVGLLGYIIAYTFSVELGWWLMAAGLSLVVMGLWEYRRLWSQHQATVDDVVRAKTYEDRMGRRETQQGASHGQPEGPVFADLGDDDPPIDRRRNR